MQSHYFHAFLTNFFRQITKSTYFSVPNALVTGLRAMSVVRFLEKLTISQLVKTFSAVYAVRRFTPRSHEPLSDPFFEPDKSRFMYPYTNF